MTSALTPRLPAAEARSGNAPAPPYGVGALPDLFPQLKSHTRWAVEAP